MGRSQTSEWLCQLALVCVPECTACLSLCKVPLNGLVACAVVAVGGLVCCVVLCVGCSCLRRFSVAASVTAVLTSS
jgi:hypothetical protein